MNRRDLLKWFGAGATIAPVVAGMPQLQAAASLIEVPKLAPVTLEKEMPKGLNPYTALVSREQMEILLIVRDRKNGSMFRMRGNSVILSARCNIFDVTTHDTRSPWKIKFAGPQEQYWEVAGVLTGTPDEMYFTP